MAIKEPKAINKKEKKNKKDKTSFFKSFKAEIKKVSWPTPKQLVNNTTAVVVIVLILAAIVFLLDSAFGAINKYGIDNIKKSVYTTESQDEETENTEEVETESGTELEVDNSAVNAETTQTESNGTTTEETKTEAAPAE